MTFEVIPAIDLIDGKCVRLVQGDFARKKIYDGDPLNVARAFADAGLARLHIVDLDGAKNGKIANLEVLESIAANTDLMIDFGGGIRDRNDLRSVFGAGAGIVSIGSIAAKEPDTVIEWLEEFGSDKILLGADVRDRKIAINGWQSGTPLDVLLYLGEWYGRGVRHAFCTDISKDGLLEGPSTQLYADILARIPDMQLIASGGVSSVQDVIDVRNAGCSGAIIGKAIYENLISLRDLASLEELESVS
ncbi:MAG TPA: 1-(5-phosphoribosyl)-5-[(5-phosphoribosylamino)methylideneamino]imidazole-4-carboxamide isomerase [Pyrinomonadaceae bacterium]|jgi:phosphoribosylformimino-5-aminoimidazole carboxamide ribotide isomerase|nr:1-(5-phosphoribosyl)-5-[(5-phosphoribosylamino)methylideneamino]imidazole-4-carboxamide isomerase [Pyrinomonadaceae bacterium]